MSNGLLTKFFRRRKKQHPVCHQPPGVAAAGTSGKVAIVGNPNVGKSVVFGRLTGRYAAISNYPGTTVHVTRGHANIDGMTHEVVDTPGMYSFLPITEEERVARNILLSEKPESVLHVVDAKNLSRMLPLTLQLIEAGLPVVLQLNMMDEAETAGIAIDTKALKDELGIPVVATAAVSGRGIGELKKTLAESCPASARLAENSDYGETLEESLRKISLLLNGEYQLSRRSLGLLLLQNDSEVAEQVKPPRPAMPRG